MIVDMVTHFMVGEQDYQATCYNCIRIFIKDCLIKRSSAGIKKSQITKKFM